MRKYRYRVSKFYPFDILILFVTFIVELYFFIRKFQFIDNTHYFYPYIILMFFNFSILVFLTIKYIPRIKRGLLISARKSKLGRELFYNPIVKAIIFTSISIIFNFGYLVFLTITAYLNKSIWHWALAIYYFVLIIIRGIVVNNEAKYRNSADYYDIKQYRNIGVSLIVLSASFIPCLVLMIVENKYFSYPGVMIYAFSAFAFYKTIVSILNYFQARRMRNFTIQTMRNISLIDSFVTILALQSALIFKFGNGKMGLIMNIVLGIVLIVLGIAIASIMVDKSKKMLKKYYYEEIDNDRKLEIIFSKKHK